MTNIIKFRELWIMKEHISSAATLKQEKDPEPEKAEAVKKFIRLSRENPTFKVYLTDR